MDPSVVFRTIEAVMYAIGALSLLSLLPLARQFTEAWESERAGCNARRGAAER